VSARTRPGADPAPRPGKGTSGTAHAAHIRKVAAEFAAFADQRTVYLKRELADMKEQKADIEGRIHAARLAHERLASFQPEIDGNLQCPRCWIEHARQSPLAAIPCTESEESFRCHVCNLGLSIPLTD
jgi:hypothetical protein